jgi:hypothetical protein
MRYMSVRKLSVGVVSVLVVAVAGLVGVSEFSSPGHPVAVDTRLGRLTLGTLPIVRSPWRTANAPPFSFNGKLVSTARVGHLGLALSVDRKFCALTTLNDHGHHTYSFQSQISSGIPLSKSVAFTNRPLPVGKITIPGGPYTLAEETNLPFSNPALENVTIACGRSAMIWMLRWKGQSQVVSASTATTTVVPNYEHKLTLGIVGSLSVRSAIIRDIGSGDALTNNPPG